MNDNFRTTRKADYLLFFWYVENKMQFYSKWLGIITSLSCNMGRYKYTRSSKTMCQHSKHCSLGALCLALSMSVESNRASPVNVSVSSILNWPRHFVLNISITHTDVMSGIPHLSILQLNCSVKVATLIFDLGHNMIVSIVKLQILTLQYCNKLAIS